MDKEALLERKVRVTTHSGVPRAIKEHVRTFAVQSSQHLELINDLAARDFVSYASTSWLEQIRSHTKVEIQERIVDATPKKQRRVKPLDFFPIIDPSNRLLTKWKIVVLVLTTIFLFEIPLTIFFGKDAFGANLWLFYLIRMLSICFFIVDMFIEFHVAYYVDTTMILDRHLVANHYLRGGFFFDVVPTFLLLLTTFIGINYLPYLGLFFFLKFNSIFEIDSRFQELLQLHRKSKIIYFVGKMIATVLFFTNLYGCLFHAAAVYMMKEYPEWNTWLSDPEGCFGVIGEYSMGLQYFFSVYWAFGTLTTICYGDIYPSNPLEIVVSEFAMVSAVYIMMINLTSIYYSIADYYESQHKFQNHVNAINRFMRDKKVSGDLQRRVHAYLGHMWRQYKSRDNKLETEIIQSLSPDLRQELLLGSYGQFILSVPWLTHFSPDFQRELALEVEERHLAQGELVFKEHDTDAYLYFVGVGQVDLLLAKRLAVLKEGTSFGEIGFLTGNPRLCSARANRYTLLYRISRDSFMRKVREFQGDYERFCQIRDDLMMRNYDCVGLRCFTCRQTEHVATDCPLTHFYRQQPTHHTNPNPRKLCRRKPAKTRRLLLHLDAPYHLHHPTSNQHSHPTLDLNLDKVHQFHSYKPHDNLDRRTAHTRHWPAEHLEIEH